LRLVDEILVKVLHVLLGGGIRFSSPGLAGRDLDPVNSTQSGAVYHSPLPRPQ